MAGLFSALLPPVSDGLSFNYLGPACLPSLNCHPALPAAWRYSPRWCRLFARAHRD